VIFEILKCGLSGVIEIMHQVNPNQKKVKISDFDEFFIGKVKLWRIGQASKLSTVICKLGFIQPLWMFIFCLILNY